MVIISCRPLNLIEEAERSSRLSGATARSLLGRVLLLNSTQGDLVPLFQLARRLHAQPSGASLEQRGRRAALEPGATPARRRPR